MNTLLKNVWVIYLAIVVAGLGGWISNVVKVANIGFEVAQWGGMEIMRVVGVFVFPLGSILGYL